MPKRDQMKEALAQIVSQVPELQEAIKEKRWDDAYQLAAAIRWNAGCVMTHTMNKEKLLEQHGYRIS